MGNSYNEALRLAIRIHDGQERKKTNIPYVTHLVAVSELVLRYGGDEEQAIAGLLHDAVEDGDSATNWEHEIRERFGERVRRIVMDCTDGVPDESGDKGDWKQRKERYVAHLSEVAIDSLLVSAADKLHNLSCIRCDLEEIGMRVFDRFSASTGETMWYYRSLIGAFDVRGVSEPLMMRLRAEYAACEKHMRKR
jgi:(p)ppGpp synthase/HD superfamily hydrolase